MKKRELTKFALKIKLTSFCCWCLCGIFFPPLCLSVSFLSSSYFYTSNIQPSVIFFNSKSEHCCVRIFPTLKFVFFEVWFENEILFLFCMTGNGFFGISLLEECYWKICLSVCLTLSHCLSIFQSLNLFDDILIFICK